MVIDSELVDYLFSTKYRSSMCRSAKFKCLQSGCLKMTCVCSQVPERWLAAAVCRAAALKHSC